LLVGFCGEKAARRQDGWGERKRVFERGTRIRRDPALPALAHWGKSGKAPPARCSFTATPACSMKEIPEKDWRYLRAIKETLVERLSGHINAEVLTLLARPELTEREKRTRVYEIVREQDRVVAACFNDWRRSNVLAKCQVLKAHGLLDAEILAKLTPGTAASLR
jgi:hypothetical protein